MGFLARIPGTVNGVDPEWFLGKRPSPEWQDLLVIRPRMVKP